MNSLMKGLGYDKYVVQGGDLGAFLGRFMAIRFDECQGGWVPLMGGIGVELGCAVC